MITPREWDELPMTGVEAIQRRARKSTLAEGASAVRARDRRLAERARLGTSRRRRVERAEREVQWMLERLRDESGAVAIMVLFVGLVAGLPLLAAVVDRGLVGISAARVQMAADAGALAGAQSCLNRDGRDEAIRLAGAYVETNGAEVESIVVESCAATGDPAVDTIRVTASVRTIRFLGGWTTIERTATASWADGRLELRT